MRYPMLVFSLFAACVSAFAPVAAAARPDTRTMTCARAQEFVRQRGAVVMTTGRHTYRRFVTHWRYCDTWQRLFPEKAPTRDNPQCIVAYRCDEPLFGPGWD